MTWQLATPDVAVLERLQLLEVNEPVELVVKLTVPTGVVTVSGEVSLTVAVQASSKPNPVATQLSVVVVARSPTTIVDAPLLVE